jgi:DNA polymerase-3 subunit delta
MAKSAPGLVELRASLKKKKFLPVYLVHGEEDLLLEESVGAIIKAALPDEERTFNLDILDCVDFDARDITARASSLPMMGERRVVVARNIERLNAKDLEVLSAYVDRPSESTLLVLSGRKADLRKKPFSTLHAAAAECMCGPLSESRLAGWIIDRVQEHGGTIDDEGAALLAAQIGSSLRELDSEITKILVFAGDRKAITAGDVAEVGGFSREFTHFHLQDAVGAGDLQKALTILDHMVDEGAEVPYIVWALTDFFGLLWRLHHLVKKSPGGDDKEGFKLTRAWAWKRQFYLESLRRYPVACVEKVFRIMTEADVGSKSGSYASKRDHLHTMLVRIMSSSGQQMGQQKSDIDV